MNTEKSGNVPADMVVGTIHATNSCGKLVIVKYDNKKDVLIRFVDTGYECIVESGHIRKGSVKDHYSPSVYGVGYLGVGRHRAKIDGVNTKVYKTWNGMLRRCYDHKCHAKRHTYIGCKVTDEWHNFQTFGDWFEANYPADEVDYALDKDLKGTGNKVYSADNCLFVSVSVNNFLTACDAARGEYMIGCCYRESKGKFQVHCRNPFTGKLDHLGYFPDELTAHLAWRDKKAEHALELANQQTNPDVKNAILRWREDLINGKIHPLDN